MKNILTIMLVLFVGTAMAQEKKVKTISFKTSAVCKMCKERIEEELNYTKGIIFAEVDLDKNIVTVKYKSKVINQDQIKGIVSMVGYDAGEVPKNPEAFNNLPKCCKNKKFCKD